MCSILQKSVDWGRAGDGDGRTGKLGEGTFRRELMPRVILKVRGQGSGVCGVGGVEMIGSWKKRRLATSWESKFGNEEVRFDYLGMRRLRSCVSGKLEIKEVWRRGGWRSMRLGVQEMGSVSGKPWVEALGVDMIGGQESGMESWAGWKQRGLRVQGCGGVGVSGGLKELKL